MVRGSWYLGEAIIQGPRIRRKENVSTSRKVDLEASGRGHASPLSSARLSSDAFVEEIVHWAVLRVSIMFRNSIPVFVQHHLLISLDSVQVRFLAHPKTTSLALAHVHNMATLALKLSGRSLLYSKSASFAQGPLNFTHRSCLRARSRQLSHVLSAHP